MSEPAVATAAKVPHGAPVLMCPNVVAGYTPEVDILNGVDLEVYDGEIVTIVGPNGAGKSTLMKSVFGLVPPRTGSISLHDNEITGLAPHSVTRAGVSYVPQLDNVFPSLTVQENLELGALAGGEGTVEERMERMFGLFPRLEERRRQAAGTMSGGERQMVAMGRALMPGPEILLLDEPSAGLAPAFVDAVFEKVARGERRGRDDPDGRAERPARAQLEPSRLRPRPRPEQVHGPGPGAGRRPEGRGALPRRRRGPRRRRRAGRRTGLERETARRPKAPRRSLTRRRSEGYSPASFSTWSVAENAPLSSYS